MNHGKVIRCYFGVSGLMCAKEVCVCVVVVGGNSTTPSINNSHVVFSAYYPLPIDKHSLFLRQQAQIHDEAIRQNQTFIQNDTDIIQPIPFKYRRYTAPLYILFPTNPSPTDCRIYYTEQQLGVYALLSEHFPTFTYVDLDNHQQILKPNYFLIHT